MPSIDLGLAFYAKIRCRLSEKTLVDRSHDRFDVAFCAVLVYNLHVAFLEVFVVSGDIPRARFFPAPLMFFLLDFEAACGKTAQIIVPVELNQLVFEPIWHTGLFRLLFRCILLVVGFCVVRWIRESWCIQLRLFFRSLIRCSVV